MLELIQLLCCVVWCCFVLVLFGLCFALRVLLFESTIPISYEKNLEHLSSNFRLCQNNTLFLNIMLCKLYSGENAFYPVSGKNIGIDIL